MPESRSAKAETEGAQIFVLGVMDEQTMQLDVRLVVVVSLASELRGVNEADPGRDVALQADEDAPSRVIVRIIDALREAGIHNPPASARPAVSLG